VCRFTFGKGKECKGVELFGFKTGFVLNCFPLCPNVLPTPMFLFVVLWADKKSLIFSSAKRIPSYLSIDSSRIKESKAKISYLK